VEEPAQLLSNYAIFSTIDRYASTAALLLLSGVQFQTGQLLDIPIITAYARERGITVGWDLAHAVGNVELMLHDWNVDFAVWCSYKYLNAGPGATAGIFVHERHGKTNKLLQGGRNNNYLPRLAGWWGMAVPQRFGMAKCEFSVRHVIPEFRAK
jgi:kynureninase